MKKIIISIVVIIAILIGVYWLFTSEIKQFFFKPTDPSGTPGISLEDTKNPGQIGIEEDNLLNQTNTNQISEDQNIEEESRQRVEVVAQNLSIPWEVALLPSGEMLVTERPGNLLKIGQDKQVIKIEGVEHVGEGGLQGLALDPNFQQNNYIYLYLTTRKNDILINRVERYTLTGNDLSNKQIIIDDLPGAIYHDGGRIAFGPDGKLYITIGDARNEASAQDINSLAGNILRINADGSIPEDNPFSNSPIYSYGHRNPQGLAWDSQGRLWATEHGRSGAASGYDELNLIQAGKNYGWPDIQGDQSTTDKSPPIIHSGPNTTWAPAGMAYYEGSLFFAGLRGETLYQYNIDSGELKYHFFGDFGRLRAVVLSEDDYLYVTTSNTDGRGDVMSGDDKIIKIDAKIFNK